MAAPASRSPGPLHGPRVDMQRLRAVLADVDAAAGTVRRVPCRPDLSRSQLAVAALLSAGLKHEEIAARLGCALATVRFFVDRGALRIPGNLPATARLIAWYRGAVREVLGVDRG